VATAIELTEVRVTVGVDTHTDVHVAAAVDQFDEVTKLRHRRDELQLHLDTEPQQIAPGDLTKISKHITDISEATRRRRRW
jgi:hypothetical protein